MPRQKSIGKAVETASPKKEEKQEINLGKLGTINHAVRIVEIIQKIVNGRLLNDVHLEDGTTYLLSDEDLKSQRLLS